MAKHAVRVNEKNKNFDMVTQEKSGIKENVIEEIINLARLYDVDRVYLFGSRARGDYKRTSDIDLAFYGGMAAQFILAVDEETSTLLEFDLVDMDKCRDEDIRASIDREGVLLYEKI